MSDGNKRYLGDVFINEDDYEYQKQFFKDIIESYQWKYGGNFDASTLQEKVPEDFATAEQGAKAEAAILSPLLLGRTEILNLADQQYIFPDAIQIDKDTETDSGRYISFIEWFDELDNTANLSEMLYTIYQNTMNITNNLDNIKLDKNTYNQFISQDYTPLKELITNSFAIFTDEFGTKVTKINADLINGLRFRLITQDAYDSLSDAEKTYWRNVFIIKDEIPPDYEDPMQWSLSDGYEFRIDDGKLQVHNVLSNDWADICTLEDLLTGAGIRSMVKDIMGEEISDVINDIQPIEVEKHWEEYPFLSSSLHNAYIKDLLIDETNTYVTSKLDNKDSLKYLNIDMNQILIDNEVLEPNGATRVNKIVDNFTQQLNSQDTRITNINNSVSQLQNDTRVSALQNDVTTLRGSINSNSARISTLEKSISNKQDKQLSLVYNNAEDDLYDMSWYSNGTLCYFKILYNLTNLRKEWGWNIGVNHNDWPSPMWGLPDDYNYYRPKYPVSTVDLSGKAQFILRNYDGNIYIRSLTGKPIKTGKFYASITYVAQGALK